MLWFVLAGEGGVVRDSFCMAMRTFRQMAKRRPFLSMGRFSRRREAGRGWWVAAAVMGGVVVRVRAI